MKKKTLFLVASMLFFAFSAKAQSAWLDDFESGTASFYANSGEMGSMKNEVVINPSKTGINTSNYVMKFTRLADNTVNWAGFWFQLKDALKNNVKPQDYRYAHIKYYRNDSQAKMNFKIESSSAGGSNIEKSSMYAPAEIQEWEDLVFDFDGGVGPYGTIAIMPDNVDNRPAGTAVYIDDIHFSNDPNPIVVFDKAKPRNVVYSNLLSNEATLSWSSMTGATSYKIYNNNVEIESTTTNTVVLSGLSTETNYRITVKGVNAASQLSLASDEVAFTTLAANKLSLPTGFVNMDKTKESTSDLTAYPEGYRFHQQKFTDKISLEWNPVFSATSYKIFKDGVEIAEIANSKYDVLNLTPHTIYNFQIQAQNTSGALSDLTEKLYVKTAETTEQRDARMAWWRDSRFGMMIHWGAYSAYAGDYKGVRADKHNGEGSYAEWIMFGQNIPVGEYRLKASEFTSENYDPQAWMKSAVDAGMKYLVFTSKHHDGFAMWNSKASSWNAAQESAAQRDVMKELIDAARAEGLKIGLYYSQALDWVNEGGLGWMPQQNFTPNNGHWPKDKQDKYVREVSVPQIKELLAEYGQIDVLWWDMGVSYLTLEHEQLMLSAIYESGQGSHVLLNNRLRYDGSTPGDFETPEQSIPNVPATGYADKHDWETCMTMNDNWGYSKHDTEWKTSEDVIHKLLDITSKGGNFLLNVGPKADGTFPVESANILAELKTYMAANSEAIYETQPCPLPNGVPYGRVTSKVSGNQTTLYVHVFDWPADGKLTVPGLYNTPVSTSLLMNGTALTSSVEINGLTLTLPTTNPGVYSTTVKIVIDGALDIQEVPVLQSESGVLTLKPIDAALATNSGICKEEKEGVLGMGCWSGDLSNNTVKWFVNIHTKGKFTVKGDIAAFENGSFNLSLGNDNSVISFVGTGGWDVSYYKMIDLGEITISETGLQYVNLSPIAEGWHPLGLRNIVLTPFDPTAIEEKNSEQTDMYVVSGNKVLSVFLNLEKIADVTINIYDVKGQLIKTEICNKLAEGRQQINFDNIEQGIYIVSAIVNDVSIIKKAVVSKG